MFVVQYDVSVKCHDKIFNKYVKHQGQISFKVTQKTRLEMREGKSYHFDKVIKKFRCVKSTLRLLLEWLGALEQPLLLIGSCDWYPLLKEIKAHEVEQLFEEKVMGFCDIRDLFKDWKYKKKLNIHELSSRLLEGYNNDNKYDTISDGGIEGDGLIWVKMLQSMLDKKSQYRRTYNIFDSY